MKPTEKQIKRVDHMAYVLGLSLPDEFTTDAYSHFISENTDEYIEAVTDNDWQYDLDEW